MRRTLTLALVPLAVGALALSSAVLPAASSAVTPAEVGAAPTVTPNPDHIATLSAVLQTMKANYPKFARQTPGPQDVFDYNLGDLWLKGIDGTGTTIALVEGWDDPQINTVIHSFDARYGLPDPDIQTIFPNGPLPAECPAGMVALQSYGSCTAWMGELRLDVEAAHLIAPYAKILITATPADSEITDDTPFQVAMPELMKAVEFVSTNHLADAMSISDGTGESTYSNLAQIHSQDPGPLTAAANGVPVMVATGDCGVVQNLAVANAQCGNTTTSPDTAAWDDSPWVTALGGSVPNVSATDGSKLGPDPVWHSGIFSEGAGFSSVYARPDYQNRVKGITDSAMRSVPDITADAQDGTSESAPEFAGILALAAQLNRGSVGPINDALYNVLGPQGARAGHRRRGHRQRLRADRAWFHRRQGLRRRHWLGHDRRQQVRTGTGQGGPRPARQHAGTAGNTGAVPVAAQRAADQHEHQCRPAELPAPPVVSSRCTRCSWRSTATWSRRSPRTRWAP